MDELQIINKDGQLLVDSRDVAEMVGKDHSNLMRDIRGYINILKMDSKLKASNFFIESNYLDKYKREKPCYMLTRKGCDMVANKLTGSKGILFTATYVTRFEEMENKLKQLNSPSYMIEDPIARAERWIQEQKEKQQIETQKLMLEQQVKEYEPKVTYYDKILHSKGTLNITQIAKDYGLSGKALNKILKEERIQYKQNGQWLLYSDYQSSGYTKSYTQEYIGYNGEIQSKLHTRWTQKGRLFIHNLLEAQGIKAEMDKEPLENIN